MKISCKKNNIGTLPGRSKIELPMYFFVFDFRMCKRFVDTK